MLRDRYGKWSGKRAGGLLLLIVGSFIGLYITIVDRGNLLSAVPLVSEFIVFGCGLLGVTLAEGKDK